MAEIEIRDGSQIDHSMSFSYHDLTKTTWMTVWKKLPPYGFAMLSSRTIDVTDRVGVYGPILNADPYLGYVLTKGMRDISGELRDQVGDILDGVSRLAMADIVLWYAGPCPEEYWSRHPHVPLRIVLRGSFILGIREKPGLVEGSTEYDVVFVVHIPMSLAIYLAYVYKSKKSTFEERYDLFIGCMATGFESLITNLLASSDVYRPKIRYELRPDSWSGGMRGCLLMPSEKNCYSTLEVDVKGVVDAMRLTSPEDPRIKVVDTDTKS